MTNIKLTTLGGVRENGKNMYIAEINDRSEERRGGKECAI